MHEPLLDQIAELERSNRRWKWTSAILAAALVGVAISGSIIGVFGLRQHALGLAERDRMMAMRARAEALRAEALAAQAEAARKQQEQPLPAPEPKKN